MQTKCKNDSDDWQKILYKHWDNIPDNYSDKRLFLDQLRTNVNVAHYSLTNAICGASYPMSQLNFVVIYLCVFEFVQNGSLSNSKLFVLVTLFAFSCALLYLLSNTISFTRQLIWDHFRTLITLIFFGYGFTPLIRTLTTSISTDTIYASSFVLFFLSLVFHDYGMPAPIVSTFFSVNLSLAASVFLISRVENDRLAFNLLAFSLCVFGFWPRLRNLMIIPWKVGAPIYLFLTGPLSIFLIKQVSNHLAIVHSIFHVFIVIIFPIILIRNQRYKSTIHGPWDEATLKE